MRRLQHAMYINTGPSPHGDRAVGPRRPRSRDAMTMSAPQPILRAIRGFLAAHHARRTKLEALH